VFSLVWFAWRFNFDLAAQKTIDQIAAMGPGELASPSFLPVDFGLKRFERRSLPMRPHLSERQRICFAVDTDEASQISVQLIQPPRETS
jgi:hypothetical protein